MCQLRLGDCRFILPLAFDVRPLNILLLDTPMRNTTHGYTIALVTLATCFSVGQNCTAANSSNPQLQDAIVASWKESELLLARGSYTGTIATRERTFSVDCCWSSRYAMWTYRDVSSLSERISNKEHVEHGIASRDGVGQWIWQGNVRTLVHDKSLAYESLLGYEFDPRVECFRYQGLPLSELFRRDIPRGKVASFNIVREKAGIRLTRVHEDGSSIDVMCMETAPYLWLSIEDIDSKKRSHYQARAEWEKDSNGVYFPKSMKIQTHEPAIEKTFLIRSVHLERYDSGEVFQQKHFLPPDDLPPGTSVQFLDKQWGVSSQEVLGGDSGLLERHLYMLSYGLSKRRAADEQ